MKQFLISLFLLLSVTYLSLTHQNSEDAFKDLSFKTPVQFSMGSLSDVAEFKKISASDEIRFQADLSKFHVTRISPTFISRDGRYIMTFVKSSSTGKIQRVLFVYKNEKLTQAIDEVIQINSQQILTSNGSISFDMHRIAETNDPGL